MSRNDDDRRIEEADLPGNPDEPRTPPPPPPPPPPSPKPQERPQERPPERRNDD